MERFLFLCLIVITVGNYQDTLAEKPTMMPQKDQLVIQEGTELKIECYSKESAVEFSFPEYTFTSPRSSHIITTAENGTSTFLRQNAVSLDTGWYACAAEGVQIENNFKNLNHMQDDISWIYIYVNSSMPFADRYYSFPKSITVLSGRPAIVPCRPTSPFLNTQLWQNSKNIRLSDEIRFDPRIGFVIDKLVFKDLVIHFHCEIDGITDKYDLYYSKTRGRKPRINLDEELSIYEGDELKIKCDGESEIQFFFPNASSDFRNIQKVNPHFLHLNCNNYPGIGDELTIINLQGHNVPSKFEIVSGENGVSTFLRRSTVPGDTGWYGCAERGINSDIRFRNYIDYTGTEINWIYVYVHSPNTKVFAVAESPGLRKRNTNVIILEIKLIIQQVQYVNGNDIKLFCRPTSSFAAMKLTCDDQMLGKEEDLRFDPKYGLIVKWEMNNSMSYCHCGIKTDGRWLYVVKVTEQQNELLVNPEQLILLTGEDLRLFYAETKISLDPNYEMVKREWIIPPAVSMNHFKQTKLILPYRKLGTTTWHTFYILESKNVTENNTGEYDMSPMPPTEFPDEDAGRINLFKVLVVDRRSCEYKKLNLQEDEYTFVRRRDETFKLMVDLQSFSSGMIQWMDPSGISIEQTETFDLNRRSFYLTRELRSLLVINNLTLDDAGVYQSKISTSVGIMTINFTLDVQAPPDTFMMTETLLPYYAVPDEYFDMSCCAIGSPIPNITWTFFKQPNYPSENDSAVIYLETSEYMKENELTRCSTVNMNTSTIGILTCTSCNSINCSTATKRIFLSTRKGGFGIIGQKEQVFFGDDVTLKCVGSINVYSKVWWDTDFDECYENGRNRTFHIEDYSIQSMMQKILYIKNVTECHQRLYYCYGTNLENHNFPVSSLYMLRLNVPKKPYFTRTTLNRSKIILDAESDHGKIQTLTCCANGKPNPSVTWFKNDLQVKENQEHHISSETCQLTVVLDLRDGNNRRYTCKAENRFGHIKNYIDYVIEVPPITSIINGTHPYYAVPDEHFPVECCAIGSPRSNITWTFLKQPKYPSNNDSSLEFPSMHKYVTHNRSAGCSDLIMNTSTVGILTCTACNSINCSMATRRIFLSGSVGRFGIIGPKEKLFFGDNVTLKCAGSIYAFRKLWWDIDFDNCYENVSHKTFHVEDSPTRFTIQNVLRIENVNECHRRTYSCLGQTTDQNINFLSYSLRLNEIFMQHLSKVGDGYLTASADLAQKVPTVPKKVRFISTSLNNSRITLDAVSDHAKIRRLTCCATGDPPPNVIWFKDDLQVNESQEHHFSPETCELFVALDLSDGNNRRYTCIAENRLEKIEDHIDFIIKGGKQQVKTIISVTIASIVTLIGISIASYVFWKCHKEIARQKFKAAILARFDEGALDYVQPNMNMASQAEVLPFDKKWEYRRELLKFDKLLGSGAFGIVRKAEAESPHPGKNATTVAVKMVRGTHRLHYMTALIRELKVLVHLGNHLNIVNLIGACTKNISYGELLVIVEFCRFGNLRDYLINHRSNFIDQVDPVTDQIVDRNLETDHVNVGCKLEHVTDCKDDSETENSCRSTDAEKRDTNTNDQLLANGLIQPGLRCHYRSDEPDLMVESICTKDLLCWAWQVTRGMRYLGLKKVVHGDLAARNVLLADNNVIKICDFGLAEILYKDDDYKKLVGDMLPLQWMAIESLRDRVFSNRSDVWSFGIVLWEFFTLAETPYCGVNPRNLYEKLSSGYRLSRPKFAPEKIYQMMMNCWNANPEQRPSFAKLDQDIGEELDNGIHTYYTDMGPMYTELDNETTETGKIDYLTMDPSEVKTAAFSTREKQIELGDIPLDEFRDQASPSTSHDTGDP